MKMTYREIQERLSDTSFEVQERHGLDGLRGHPNVKSRLVFAQHIEGRLGGFSFWLAGEHRTWFLGLWSNRVYRFRRPARMIDCLLFLAKSGAPLRKTPSKLPKRIRDAFDLEEVPIEDIL